MKKFCFSGQSIVETIVVVGIVVLLSTGLVAATTSILQYGQMSKNRAKATQYAKEGLEIVRIIKDTSWSTIPKDTSSYCLSKNQQSLGTSVTPPCPYDIDNLFSRSVSFSDDETTCVSPVCRKVTVTVTWKEKVDRSVILTSYITNWRAR